MTATIARQPSTRNHPLVESEIVLRLDFHEQLLGSQPTSNIALDFVRQKSIEERATELMRGDQMSAVKAKKVAEEERRVADDLRRQAEDEVNESLPPRDEDSDEESDADGPIKPTAFHTDHIGLHLFDYQVRGFMKETVKNIEVTIAGKGEGTKRSANFDINRKVFVFGEDYSRRLYLKRDGKVLEEFDEYFGRPLRASTAMGPRVSIAVSETINPPVETIVRIQILKGATFKRAQLEEIMSYGMFQGMGQFRSGGFGRFTATIIEE